MPLCYRFFSDQRALIKCFHNRGNVLYFYAYLLILNLYTIGCYGLDKLAAKQGRWRVTERKLQILALLGGWPGAMLSQRLFRHKIRKQRFRALFYLVIIINTLLLASGFYLVQGLS